MLPLSTILYLFVLFLAIFGSVFITPFIGAIGYLVTYHINPVSQWWGSYVPFFLQRYALIIGSATFLGILIHKNKLRYSRFFDSQEILLILLLFLIWLSIPIGLDLTGGIDEFAFKMTKITLMVFLASHLITDLKKYEIMVYVFIITGFYLGVQTYNAPASFYISGRLGGGIGGSDLSNGNMLAAHFCMVLSFIGVMFLKSGWKTKLLCFVSAAFIVNSIILIRSRGSFLGLLCGAMSAIFIAKHVGRKKIMVLLLLGFIASWSLVNEDFLERMKLISTNVEEMDISASSRIDVWKISLNIIKDYPFGVGVGNSARIMESYNDIYSGRDTHNTYIRALTDLGYQGLLIYLILMANAFRILLSTEKLLPALKNHKDFYWHIFALKIGLISYFVVVTFVSATYVEEFFWFIMFPLFLKRSVENEILLNGDLHEI